MYTLLAHTADADNKILFKPVQETIRIKQNRVTAAQVGKIRMRPSFISPIELAENILPNAKRRKNLGLSSAPDKIIDPSLYLQHVGANNVANSPQKHALMVPARLIVTPLAGREQKTVWALETYMGRHLCWASRVDNLTFTIL
jgi:hypothetical protein